jgi:hypothetical protein
MPDPDLEKGVFAREPDEGKSDHSGDEALQPQDGDRLEQDIEKRPDLENRDRPGPKAEDNDDSHVVDWDGDVSCG